MPVSKGYQMWKLVSPPDGLTTSHSPLYQEMQAWADDGLIPQWGVASLSDEVITSILKSVREHVKQSYESSRT